MLLRVTFLEHLGQEAVEQVGITDLKFSILCWMLNTIIAYIIINFILQLTDIFLDGFSSFDSINSIILPLVRNTCNSFDHIKNLHRGIPKPEKNHTGPFSILKRT